ncbi:MAG TPA: protein-tyrosine phosphatase family protein [Bauldia sp.]|nr:protein-tyrosine phosphatase family protein [Bauldia sp.]
MPQVLVSPLSRVAETVRQSGASHLVTLINRDTPVARPDGIAAENHLFLGMNDIVEPMEGLIPPAEEHIATLLQFVSGWDRRRPMVVHCFAGISRSTAAAFVVLCAVNPARSELEIASRIRAESRFAYPNPRIVNLGDRALGRNGRMVTAAAAIGRGELADENVPFAIAIAE